MNIEQLCNLIPKGTKKSTWRKSLLSYFPFLKLRTWKSRSKFHWNFFRLKKMAPWNATKECWTTFFFSFYPLLLWVLRLFLDFYALDQFINPSFLVLEAEHDQDINSRPKPRWLETKVSSSLFFPFQRSKSWLDYAYLGASL